MLRVELLIVLFRRNVSPDRADRESKNKSDPKRQQTYHDINEKHDERTDQRRVAPAARPTFFGDFTMMVCAFCVFCS